MDLARKYPLAQKAFETQDIFHSKAGERVPRELLAARLRMAELVDKFAPGTPAEKEAFIIAGAISLEPFSGSKMYGDPDYGSELDRVMIELVDAAKTPGAAVSPRLAPLITALMVVKMEQTMDEVDAGTRQVTMKELKATYKRSAVNDEICLTNLRNKELKDLYETTQMFYLTRLEQAVHRPKIPPGPLNPKP